MGGELYVRVGSEKGNNNYCNKNRKGKELSRSDIQQGIINIIIKELLSKSTIKTLQ